MVYPDRLLARGEQVLLHRHPHGKTLIPPVLWLLVVIGVASFAAAYISKHQADPTWWWVGVGAAAVLAIGFLSLAPFIRWRTEHFVLTNRHVFFRTGFVQRREHQIQLGRIQNIEVRVSFWGRILGFGTLIVESAADEPLAFANVASLPTVQRMLNQLVDDDRTGRAEWDHPEGAYAEHAYPEHAYPDETEVEADLPTRRIPRMVNQRGGRRDR